MAVDLSGYLSRGEVALALRCSGEYVGQLARTGRLPSVATPNGRLFHRADVERLAAERAGRGRPAALPPLPAA